MPAASDKVKRKKVLALSQLTALLSTYKAASRRYGVPPLKTILAQIDDAVVEGGKPINKISLQGPDIGWQHLAAVLDCLAGYTSVKNLCLWACNIGDEGLMRLATMLKSSAAADKWWKGSKLKHIEICRDGSTLRPEQWSERYMAHVTGELPTLGSSYQLPSLLLHQAEAVTSDTLKLAGKPLPENQPQFWHPRRQWLEIGNLLPTTLNEQDDDETAAVDEAAGSRTLLHHGHLNSVGSDSVSRGAGGEEGATTSTMTLMTSSGRLLRQGSSVMVGSSALRSGSLRVGVSAEVESASSNNAGQPDAAAPLGRRWGVSLEAAEEALVTESGSSKQAVPAANGYPPASASAAVPRMLLERPNGFKALHQDYADRLIPKIASTYSGPITSLKYEDLDLRRSRIIHQIHEYRDERGLHPLLDAPQAPRSSRLPLHSTPFHTTVIPSTVSISQRASPIHNTAGLVQPITYAVPISPPTAAAAGRQNPSIPSFEQPEQLSFSPAALKQLSLGLSVLGLGLQVLSLDHNQLGNAGLRALSHGIKRCPTLLHLSLENCGIGPSGAEALADSFIPNPDPKLAALQPVKILAINLSRNPLGGDGLGALCEGLATGAPALRILNLSACHITDEHVPALHALAQVFQLRPSLEQVDLDANFIGDAGASVFIPVLSSLPHMRKFRISSRGISEKVGSQVTSILKINHPTKKKKKAAVKK
ncbi:hypothetical protein CEUSTIGMA_g10711.t1 [Chlamydomonas eustigma]|uniref:Uncharacterized protein n=1 Tax=Chlamydomonas eustigma TaxID=1157962 RepID=A0A250XJM4_9CHLO|nr:hypothetical protein CEUSTIGMA_g10711.t1 [Chlamydomonas eustigma]|eukprot:GAX83285.1 hypothetical protein CEUSTIGMA_g10711.t1 [Chlamydomonas eustigma]